MVMHPVIGWVWWCKTFPTVIGLVEQVYTRLSPSPPLKNEVLMLFKIEVAPPVNVQSAYNVCGIGCHN